MSSSIAPPNLRYVAQLDHVGEVSLLGAADLAYWSNRIAPEGLTPAAREGKALILVTAAGGRFKGIRFRELSFSVLVASRGGQALDRGVFLVEAYNSNRFFAFCERLFFATPYYPGNVRLEPTPPAWIRLERRGAVAFEARMGLPPDGRVPARCGDEGWEGPVFLPRRLGNRDQPGRWFHARLHGHTLAYPFARGLDTFTVHPGIAFPVLETLAHSGFAPLEWSLRADAHHGKSKTYRDGLPPA